MLIEMEQTPNPNSMKFKVENNWINFIWEVSSFHESKKSYLSEQLFKIPGVIYLLFGSNFVVINKKNESDWNSIVYLVNEYISEFLRDKKNLFDMQKKSIIHNRTDLSELEEKIILVLEEKVQPALETHGGAIEFLKFENGVLFLNLKGACKGCPSSEITLKEGIFNLMHYFFPEINQVFNVD